MRRGFASRPAARPPYGARALSYWQFDTPWSRIVPSWPPADLRAPHFPDEFWDILNSLHIPRPQARVQELHSYAENHQFSPDLEIDVRILDARTIRLRQGQVFYCTGTGQCHFFGIFRPAQTKL